jgi:hypothetical protein
LVFCSVCFTLLDFFRLALRCEARAYARYITEYVHEWTQRELVYCVIWTHHPVHGAVI